MEYLDLSMNNLGVNYESSILLGYLIQESSSLKDLNLSQCDLKSEQILYLAHNLKM